MNSRKKKILESAMTLFARKGFDATSIQEIADRSGVAKGSVYSYFLSKEEIMTEIFRYYYEKMQEQTEKTERALLSPRERFSRQLTERLTAWMKHQDFILMLLREQVFLREGEWADWIRRLKQENGRWYKKNILALYGPEIEPYLPELSLALEGMIGSFLPIAVKEEQGIDGRKLAAYLLTRLDNLANGILAEKPEPFLSAAAINSASPCLSSEQWKKKEASRYISELEQTIESLPEEQKQKQEWKNALALLKQEMGKEKPQTFVIKGMLAHFKGIPRLEKYRKKIADRLDLELL